MATSSLGYFLRYGLVCGSGIAALLAGASVVHIRYAPDLTLPPPPADLQRRLEEAEANAKTANDDRAVPSSSSV